MEDIPVCLDLERFVERSNGIFGKSGTGKTFLTRICLCGTIKHNKAVNLVFDMHGEYGWKGTTEDPTKEGVDGLKKYFGDPRPGLYDGHGILAPAQGAGRERMSVFPTARSASKIFCCWLLNSTSTRAPPKRRICWSSITSRNGWRPC